MSFTRGFERKQLADHRPQCPSIEQLRDTLHHVRRGVVLAKDQTAIVGIGWTAFTRNSQASTMSLAAEASFKAIGDAGLTPRDIDGVMSWFHRYSDGVSPEELGTAMSLECPFAPKRRRGRPLDVRRSDHCRISRDRRNLQKCPALRRTE